MIKYQVKEPTCCVSNFFREILAGEDGRQIHTGNPEMIEPIISYVGVEGFMHKQLVAHFSQNALDIWKS